MTYDQIQLLKNSYMKESTRPNGRKGTVGEYMKFLLDGNIDFVTSKDLVLFDDTNQLLHCICINEDAKSQADFPIKLISSNYDIVQQVETVMSKKNFESFLDGSDGYISELLSDDKKSFILNWSRSIRNQAIQPMEADPYYTQNPTIIPTPTSTITRDDGVTHATSPATSNFTSIYTELIESAIESNGTVTLQNNISLTDQIVVSNDTILTIDLNGYNIDNNTNSDYAIIVDSGELIIKDSTNSEENSTSSIFSSNGSIVYLRSQESHATVTINDGTFITYNGNIPIVVDCGTLYIEGGRYVSSDTIIQSTDNGEEKDIQINDGDFFTDADVFEGESIVVYGGNYSTEIDAEYVATNYEQVETDEGGYTVSLSYSSSVNGTLFTTLQEAVTYASENNINTVNLIKDVYDAPGVIVPSGSNIEIDFNEFNYHILNTVGSTGTATNGFQLLKDSNVTIKNGTVTKGFDGTGILIQNYSNLTLEDVTLIGPGAAYVLSNNNGNIILRGNTNITADEGKFAFDAYYWPSNGYGAISITTDNLIGTINGKVEVGHDSSVDDATAAEFVSVTINSGTFTTLLNSEWIAEGYESITNEDGTYTIAQIIS